MRDPKERRRLLCQSCRYPMVYPHDFEGNSSRDAPDIGGYGAQDAGLWAWFYNLVRGSSRLRQRQSEAKRLRETILPEFPKSQICPQCFAVVRLTATPTWADKLTPEP